MDLSLKRAPCGYSHLVLCSYKPEIDCISFDSSNKVKEYIFRFFLTNLLLPLNYMDDFVKQIMAMI